MNWGKILLTGVVGGIVVWLYSFVMHGIIMSSTYAKYTTLFIQGEVIRSGFCSSPPA